MEVVSGMENKGNECGSCIIGGFDSQETFAAAQIIVVEQLFEVCAEPSYFRRFQRIREIAVLYSLESEEVKDWFQNRRKISLLSMAQFDLAAWLLEEQRNLTYVQARNDQMVADKQMLPTENGHVQKEL